MNRSEESDDNSDSVSDRNEAEVVRVVPDTEQDDLENIEVLSGGDKVEGGDNSTEMSDLEGLADDIEVEVVVIE